MKIKTAFFVLPADPATLRLTLNKKAAGIKVLDRTLFTLKRAGVETVAVIAPQGYEDKVRQRLKSLEKDPRNPSHVQCLESSQIVSGSDDCLNDWLTDSEPVLMVRGTFLATARTLGDFVNQAMESKAFLKGNAVVMDSAEESGNGWYLIPSAQRERLTEALQGSATVWRDDERIQVPGCFLPFDDIAGMRSAEKKLIDHHKHHYTQLMDKWVNCHLSLKTSFFLLKTPLTPNQLTLFGLFIGLTAGILFAQGTYLAILLGGILSATTAVWDCCDGDVARLKFLESDFGETLDTICDNLINVFVFTGMCIGVARQNGLDQALIPFALLALGGFSIFLLLYFPRGEGKGSAFKGSRVYDWILILASRNFIYVILIFSIFGRIDWFLWMAGLGAPLFALVLLIEKLKIGQNSPQNYQSG